MRALRDRGCAPVHPASGEPSHLRLRTLALTRALVLSLALAVDGRTTIARSRALAIHGTCEVRGMEQLAASTSADLVDNRKKQGLRETRWLRKNMGNVCRVYDDPGVEIGTSCHNDLYFPHCL